MRRAQLLDRLFRPSSIAIIGASHDTQKGGGFLLRGLIKNGFEGRLYPVNPSEPEIMGLTGYTSVLNIPDEVDLAIVAVPAKIVPQVMLECGQKGVKFAVVHSVGFAELGKEGKALQDEMNRIARQSGIRVVGPNCMGLYSPQVRLNTIIPTAKIGSEAGWVAFVGQSGWATGYFIEMGYEAGLRFSHVVSVGNQADLTIEDFIEYLGDDDQTRVIGCYIEGIKQGRRFLQLVRQISLQKPVVVWKGGRTEAGARAAASHTASLAGDSRIFDAALKQSGAVVARNMEELIDLAIGFTCPVLPGGNRLGVVVEAGGGAVASADIHQELGLEMPILSEEAQKELVNALHGSVVAFPSLQNPVDVVWPLNWATGWAILQCLRIVLKEVDAAVAIEHAPFNERLVEQIATLRDETKKPIMLIPGHPTEQRSGMSLLARKGIPTFNIPERALRVVAAMVRYANYRRHG